MNNNSSNKFVKRAKLRAVRTGLMICLVFAAALFAVIHTEWFSKLYCAAGTEDPAEYESNYSFNLHFLDVGKADCILIDADGQFILVDSGTSDSEELIENYLSALGVEKLDAVINTHPDKDHLGSFEYLSDKFEFEKFYKSLIEGDSSAYDDLMDELAEKDIPVQDLQSGDSLTFGKLKMEVIAPIESYDDTNSMSIVMKCTYGDFTFLLTGDMTKDEIGDILDTGVDIKADLMKVAHHGSKNGTTDDLLDAVSPTYAVISCGPNDSNLPSSKTLKLLEEADIKVYDTEDCGNIIFSLDENSQIIIKTEYN